jgi:hypothetical protein
VSIFVVDEQVNGRVFVKGRVLIGRVVVKKVDPRAEGDAPVDAQPPV